MQFEVKNCCGIFYFGDWKLKVSTVWQSEQLWPPGSQELQEFRFLITHTTFTWLCPLRLLHLLQDEKKTTRLKFQKWWWHYFTHYIYMQWSRVMVKAPLGHLIGLLSSSHLLSNSATVGGVRPRSAGWYWTFFLLAKQATNKLASS